MLLGLRASWKMRRRRERRVVAGFIALVLTLKLRRPVVELVDFMRVGSRSMIYIHGWIDLQVHTTLTLISVNVDDTVVLANRLTNKYLILIMCPAAKTSV